MKFISKNGNYRVILDRGVPAEPISGRSAIPGLSIKFEGGVAIVNDENVIKKMMAHSAFNRDFIVAEEGALDPYAGNRKPMEPTHDITRLKYGHIESASKHPAEISPETKKVLMEMAASMATSMAKEMAPKLAVEMLKNMKADFDAKPAAKKAAKSKQSRNVAGSKITDEASEG